jgi:hypothetical protein
MIATACECYEVTFYPIDPQFADIVEVVDHIATGRQTEPIEFEGHIWYSIGPLDCEDMEFLQSAALGFLLNCLPLIDATGLVEPMIEPDPDEAESKELIGP